MFVGRHKDLDPSLDEQVEDVFSGVAFSAEADFLTSFCRCWLKTVDLKQTTHALTIYVMSNNE